MKPVAPPCTAADIFNELAGTCVGLPSELITVTSPPEQILKLINYCGLLLLTNIYSVSLFHHKDL